MVRSSRRPLLVAGGGVIYAEACQALGALAQATGIPVCETQAGRGALPHGHPQALGAVGVTGTLCANRMAAQADLVIGVGTRWSDFTTASKTAFAHPEVRFININVAELDASKHAGLALLADARTSLEELAGALAGHHVPATYAAELATLRAAWERELERLVAPGPGPRLSQAEVIGLINDAMSERDVLVNAAGSAPGDLHKLFRSRDPKSYHVEYGYSCMAYEIPGAMGAKLAAPDREVYVLIGDGSYLMMPGDLHTAVQEGIKLTIVLVDNHGFASIGSLSRSLGSSGFGTEYRRRGADGQLSGPLLGVDFVANARSLGARALRADDRESLQRALSEAREQPQTTLIVVETDPAPERRVPGYESWWDVPVAEVSRMPEVQRARAHYEEQRRRERAFHAEKR
jgi:3D-(3,5/4)-trihydroxycyclohexane-1,2-dione acylhydrolase (decyclizing)